MRCISPIYIRKTGQSVPCGKCNFCLQTKRADWSFRLNQELKQCDSAHFLTFTYDDETIPTDPLSGLPTLSKSDVQLFVKRLRKVNKEFSAYPLRYYTVGEYGSETSRPHYHSIMFNLAEHVAERLENLWAVPRGKTELVHAGHVHVGAVEIASIQYVTKYVINRAGEYTGREPPFSFMSKRPGLGASYLDTHRAWHRKDLRNYTNVNGQTSRLPRYYKEKLFSKLEKAKLALEAVGLSDQKYYDEVVRLARYHPHPMRYLDEIVQQKHDNLFKTLNEKNTY
ncbi:replication initiator protein [Blackfly microvirus SF02]|uniref:Replication initiator protein n=1 Tax=Blackfly microvirus SF02 TaxID=2576452 RepID=A0A4V1F5H2_9VIRU|nr:replication initiator protein [Blackfly microvirus SF02]